MKWRYFLAWLPGVFIAIINGTIRQFVYLNYLQELPAHQLSVLSFIMLFGIYVWFILPWLKIPSGSEALRIGFFWLIFTVIFEFIFGHFVMGNSWSRLLYDYNFLQGRLWIVVLFWTTMAPYVFYQIRNRSKRLVT